MRALRRSTQTSAPSSRGAPTRGLVWLARAELGARAVVLAGLRAYKLLLSPLFAGACRHVPSCSDYAAEAVTTHGVLRGSWLAARRLGRCRPFGTWGFDPVPPAHEPGPGRQMSR